MEKTGEFSNIKRKLLAEQAEEQIYRYIIDTPFEIGSKLPNEFELAEPKACWKSGEVRALM